MGKKKREKSLRVSETTPAERHTFSYGGLLGHDLTASPWIVNVSEQTALTLDVVVDCVTVIADAIAGSDVGQWNGTERIDPPSAFTLRPDPDLTRRDFLWAFAANLALYRAAYLEEARFDGQVVGVRLHCIASVTRQGGDYYIGGQRVLNRMRLIRYAIWPTVDPDTGSVLALAREVFAGAMAANAYQSDYWQQGGAPVMYLKTEQEITSDQATGISDSWVAARTTNPGRPPTLGKGADAKTLGADLGTGGADNATDSLRSSIARYFKMPPGIVNVPSMAGPLTYSTVEQEAIHLVRYTIQPYCDVIGEALSAYLPGDYLLGDRIVLDPSALTRADQLTRYQAWQLAIDAQWMSPEEVRAQEKLAPGAPAPRPLEVPANVGA